MMSMALCTVKLKSSKSEILSCMGFFIILRLYGCVSKFVAGEGFSVMAEIRNSYGKQLNNCIIELREKDGTILDGPDMIPGKFHKIFTVGPNKADYLINIICAGYKAYQISVAYGEVVTPNRPLILGKVTMKLL